MATKRTEREERLRPILEAAIAVFVRFGYRKTSMDEVAKAAKLSRQGLYLHFTAKEELFRAALQHALESSLLAALRVLGDSSLSLEARLVGAFDEWHGRYVDARQGDAADLAEASGAVLGSMLSEHEERFLESLGKALRAAGLPAAYKRAGLSARQLAATLYATARGLKHTSPTRQAFRESFSVAARVLCFPLRDAC